MKKLEIENSKFKTERNLAHFKQPLNESLTFKNK